MTPAWRERFRATDLAVLLHPITLAMILLSLVLVGTLAWAAFRPRAATAAGGNYTYCTDVASPTTAKCPPEPGTRVIATYPGGLVATLTWEGGQWWQHLPGGKLIEAPIPHDWRLP